MAAGKMQTVTAAICPKAVAVLEPVLCYAAKLMHIA